MICKLSLWVILPISLLIGCSTYTSTSSPTADFIKTQTPDLAMSIPTVFADENAIEEATQTPYTPRTQAVNSTTNYNGYTHHQPDGNRFVDGIGQIPGLSPLDIPLPGPAAWIVAIPWGTGSFWAVVLTDGQVLGFQVNANSWLPAEVTPNHLEAGQPPLLLANGTQPNLLIAPSILASPLTHAIPYTGPYYSQTFIDTTGNLIRVDPNLRQAPALEVNALPDARILSDKQGRLLFLTGVTEQYDHGVLGDALEASSFTLIQNPLRGEYTTITMPAGLVIEGIAPIWADLNGDGEKEIIVTVSNAQQGAQILAFNEGGELVAAGPSIGQGYRWRHQIAAGPFGPNGEIELIDVLTPHLGGIVEFYRWEGNQLKIVAQIADYTSHIIGTRNLDMAVAGDFDSDGRVELLLPRQNRNELGAIRRTDDSAEVVWSLPLDGQIITNIGVVTLADGSIAIGIGQENDILLSSENSLRIWHP